MLRKTLYKGFSMLLALLVLFSTVSFTIEKHFCSDVLIDVALFTDVKKCDMDTSELNHETILNKTCCKDEISVFQGQDDLRLTSYNDLNVFQQFFITTFTYTFLHSFEDLSQYIIPHKNYSPPILVADIQVLDQVFTI